MNNQLIDHLKNILTYMNKNFIESLTFLTTNQQRRLNTLLLQKYYALTHSRITKKTSPITTSKIFSSIPNIFRSYGNCNNGGLSNWGSIPKNYFNRNAVWLRQSIWQVSAP